MLKNAGVPDGEVLQESLVLGYLGLEGGEGDPRLMTRCSVLHSIFHCHYTEVVDCREEENHRRQLC